MSVPVCVYVIADDNRHNLSEQVKEEKAQQLINIVYSIYLCNHISLYAAILDCKDIQRYAIAWRNTARTILARMYIYLLSL